MQKRTHPTSARIHANASGLVGAVLVIAMIALSAPVASASDGVAAKRVDRKGQERQRIAMPANTVAVSQTRDGFRGVAAKRINDGRRGRHHIRRHNRAPERRVHGHAQTYNRLGRVHNRSSHSNHRSGLRFDIGSRIRIGLPKLSVSIGTGHHTHGYRQFDRTYSHVFPKTHVRTYTHHGHKTHLHGHKKHVRHSNSFQRGERNHYGERIHTSPRVERLRRQHYGYHGSLHQTHRRTYQPSCRGGVRTHSLNPYRR